MHSGKFLFFIGLITVFSMPAIAQAKFTTVIDGKEVGKGDYVQVQYIVENASTVESLTPPAFPGFSIVSGPMQQNGMSIINGAVSKYEGVTYVLKPSATGKFLIGGATAVVDGRQLRSNNVTVVVTNARPKPSNISNNPFFGLSVPEEAPEVNEEYILRKGESAAEKTKDNLLVKLDVSKTSCYVGEPIVATYKLYSRVRSESKVTKRPSLSQFSVYDMVQPEANNPSVEKLNGKLFTTHIIRKVQLYPLQDGVFDLDPLEVDNTVSFLRMENNNSNKASLQQLMDDYINGVSDGRLEEQQVSLASKPVAITVKPLPLAGKPSSFDGAVGKFTISASAPKKDVAAGETVSLQVVLKGQGNLTLINAPQVQWPQGTEGYEPTVKETLDKTVAPINGNKVFEYSFSAKQPGTVTIPAIEFSYFDPAANSYKILRTDSIAVRVSKSLKKRNQPTANPGNPATDDEFHWLKLLWLLPILAIAVLVLFINRRKKDTTQLINTPPVNSQPVLPPTDPFEGAKHALAAVNSQLFYKETGRATWQILSEKFNLTSSQLSKPVVVKLLQQSNASAQTIQLLEKVLNDCELALYTPVHTETDMRITLEKAEQFRKLLGSDGL